MVTAAALLVVGIGLAGPAAWRIGGVGIVAVALGLAAGRTGAAAASPPAAFLASNAALQVTGLVLVGWGVYRGLMMDRRRPALGGGAAALCGALLLLGTLVPIVAQAGAARVLLAAVILTGLGSAVLVPALAWRARIVARLRPELPLALAPGPSALLALALLAVTLGTHVGILLAGGVTAAWAAWWSVPPPRPRPVEPGVVTVLLAVALHLLDDIAGPVGLLLRDLPAVPLSSAAEVLLAPLFLGAAWALGGLWPWRQPVGGALTAIVAALLLVRVALPGVPAGLEHWRAAAFPVVLVGVWYGALAGRPVRLAVAGALLGLVSVREPGRTGAGWLLAVAVGVVLVASAPAAWRARPAAAVVLMLAAGWGGLLVLESGLRSEVVYTVGCALGTAVGLAGSLALTPSRGGSIFPARRGKSFKDQQLLP